MTDPKAYRISERLYIACRWMPAEGLFLVGQLKANT